MNDDWAYLLPARRLAETGILRLTDWAPATQVLHVAWGALFVKVFGLHIGWLKLPMLAWSGAAAVLLFKLLSEEGAPESSALLASLAMALNPVVLVCSMTFMTDVPYLALETASLYALCRGLRTKEDGWLAAGGGAAAAAFLVRQIGLFVPIAAALELRRQGRLDVKRAALLLAPSLAAAAAYTAWFRFSHGPTVASHLLLDRMVAAASQPVLLAGRELERLAQCALTLGLFAFPISLLLFRGGRAGRAANAFLIGAAWFVALRGPLPYPQNSFQVSGLGWVTVPGEPFKASGFYAWRSLWLLLTGAGAAGMWLLLARAPEAFRRPSGACLRVLGWAAVLQLVPSLAWSAFFDRYLLPLLPLALGLPALASPRRGAATGLSAAALAAMTVVWLLGAADFACWNRAEAALWSRVRDRGVPAEKVAGGWDWEAFYVYERAEAELRAARPVETIKEWDWRGREKPEVLISFEPNPETHWKGIEPLDRQSYETPLSGRDGILYAYKLGSL